jgi:hypothetical protein
VRKPCLVEQHFGSKASEEKLFLTLERIRLLHQSAFRGGQSGAR